MGVVGGGSQERLPGEAKIKLYVDQQKSGSSRVNSVRKKTRKTLEHLKVSEAGGPGGWKGEQPESKSGHRFCKASWPKARISA